MYLLGRVHCQIVGFVFGIYLLYFSLYKYKVSQLKFQKKNRRRFFFHTGERMNCYGANNSAFFVVLRGRTKRANLDSQSIRRTQNTYLLFLIQTTIQICV